MYGCRWSNLDSDKSIVGGQNKAAGAAHGQPTCWKAHLPQPGPLPHHHGQTRRGGALVQVTSSIRTKLLLGVLLCCFKELVQRLLGNHLFCVAAVPTQLNSLSLLTTMLTECMWSMTDCVRFCVKCLMGSTWCLAEHPSESSDSLVVVGWCFSGSASVVTDHSRRFSFLVCSTLPNATQAEL